jgi:acyl dehydratase
MNISELTSLVGHELAPSAWITIDQARIDAFAACTDDHQFIHTDPERSRRESPYGTTIAHGFLSLSLLAAHRPADFPTLDDLGLTINYGLDRLRFLAPVPAGSRVRLLTRVLDAQPKGPGRMLIKQEKTMQIEGSDKPAYVAEQLTMFVARVPAA